MDLASRDKQLRGWEEIFYAFSRDISNAFLLANEDMSQESPAHFLQDKFSFVARGQHIITRQEEKTMITRDFQREQIAAPQRIHKHLRK